MSSKTWRESTSASSGSNSSRGSFRTSTKKTSRKQFNEADIEEMRQKLAEMEDMIQPPKNSPPQSPKPPSYAPPATDDSSSAIYWSGWNNTDSTTVKSEGERDDDNEDSNIDMYEKAYRANDTEGINPSNVVNDHSHKNVNEATATATAIETSTSMDNVEKEERFSKNSTATSTKTLSSHMGNAWSRRGRPNVGYARGGIKRRGGGMTRGMSRRNFHQRG